MSPFAAAYCNITFVQGYYYITYTQSFSDIIDDTALLDVHPLLVIEYLRDSIPSWITYSNHDTDSDQATSYSPFHLHLTLIHCMCRLTNCLLGKMRAC